MSLFTFFIKLSVENRASPSIYPSGDCVQTSFTLQ